MLKIAPEYHAHVYFTLAEREAAQRLHDEAEAALAAQARVYPLRPRPVGPHPLPMFEIEFAYAHRDAVIGWLQAHHGPFSVLLHPVTGDDLADHRDHPHWLGTPLTLNLSIF